MAASDPRRHPLRRPYPRSAGSWANCRRSAPTTRLARHQRRAGACQARSRAGRRGIQWAMCCRPDRARPRRGRRRAAQACQTRTGATTINKVCGSGMKATMLGHDIINAGSADIVLSGGMESMSNAPYLLAKARAGYRGRSRPDHRSHDDGRPRGRL